MVRISSRSPWPLVLLVLGAGACAPARPATPSTPAPRPAAEELGSGPPIERAAPGRVPRDILGTAKYDLPVEANRWVELELDFLVNQRRAVIARWLERADFYAGWVQDVFAGYGLPRDLHHLAMVESGYSPTARSRAGAVGMWQFMPATGRGMGLRIDEMVDERMDPVRATHAAARHLRQLHGGFRGDWPLAAAAYNAGSGRINRGLGRFGAKTFWELAERGDLAEETKHYVPRLYAVTIIGRDPTRFGYPAQTGVVRRFAFDSLRVDLTTPLVELARLGNVPLGELVALNPHLLQQVVPAGYIAWVPNGKGASLLQAYTDSDFRRQGGLETYVVRRGDTPGTLAVLGNVTAARIRELNPRINLDRIEPGTPLRLPAAAARALASRPEERPRSEPRVAVRDSSAKAAEVPAPPRSRAANAAVADTTSPKTPAAKPARSARAGDRTEPAARTAKGGDSARQAGGSTDGARRPPERTHVVESGETLWGIARRFEVTVAALREANDLAAGRTIQAGDTLRIPRDGAPRVASVDTVRRAARRDSVRNETPARRASSSDSVKRPPARRSGAGDSTVTRDSSRTAARRSTTPRDTAASTGSRSSAAGAAAPPKTAARRDSTKAAAPARRDTTPTARSGGSRPTEHVVESGETLWAIARRFDVTVAKLREANDLAEDEPIRPGQKLRIPR